MADRDLRRRLEIHKVGGGDSCRIGYTILLKNHQICIHVMRSDHILLVADAGLLQISFQVNFYNIADGYSSLDNMYMSMVYEISKNIHTQMRGIK